MRWDRNPKVDPTPVLVKTYKDGSKRWHSEACPYCGGTGYRDEYSYVDGARCWKCNATGYRPHDWTEKSEERVEKEREKNKQKLIAQAEERNKNFLERNGFNKDGKSYLVLGNTYDIKDELRAMGGKWDPVLGWKIPENNDKYITVEIDITDIAHTDDNGWLCFKSQDDLFDLRDKIQNENKPKNNDEDLISDYVGNIGDKITVDVTLKSSYSYDSMYGTSTIYKFVDKDGNIFIWNTSSAPRIEEDYEYTIAGTVKDHKEYKGEKETILTRVKII